MRTRLLQPADAAVHMRQGGVVAYPTEAVYGLGCDPADERAVNHILALKNRPVSAGLILIGADFAQPFLEFGLARLPAGPAQPVHGNHRVRRAEP